MMNIVKVLIGLIACFVIMVGLACGLLSAAGVENSEKILKPLGVTGGDDIYRIPEGSTIIHHPENVTEVYNPDGQLLSRFKDEEVGKISTPWGSAKATRVYEVPSGSFVHGLSEEITEVYGPTGRLILKVVDLSRTKTETRTPPAFSGWIESAYYYATDQDISYFYAKWQCPTLPSNSWIDDDVVYLFPSITADGKGAWAGRRVIVQPVLGYNDDGLWPGNPNRGRCWVVDDQNNYYRTNPVDVSVGDWLDGPIYWLELSPGVWGYVFYFRNLTKGTGVSMSTDLAGVANQRLDTALEGYNLETTSDLYGTCDFINMEFWRIDYEYGGSDPTSITWHKYIAPGAPNYFQGLDVLWWGDEHTRLCTGR